MRWRGTTAGVCGMVALVLACAPAAGAAGRPAVFRVGAATASIDPTGPVYAGGFGMSPPITRVHDPLSVRAIYISNGRHAVEMATVDSQAYFAAYQEGDDLGITSAREDAARTISALGGPRVTRADIIVQGTHSHAGPTLEGIWGPVPPAYLKLVHDRTVAALVEAARRARPARLQWGRVDAPELDNINVAQTDSYAGWVQDGQLSVLGAVDAAGGTVATFVNVPAHPDIVCGSCLKLLSADYFGAVRDDLERKLGGIAVVGPATLGREETPVQTAGLANMRWFAEVVSGLATRALASARWVTDPTVASAESLIEIPGTNAALLALVAANHAPDAQKQQIADASGIYPIDRADTPPYLTGSVIGTWLTALRIGRLAYLSMPGEPFPEVRYAIAGAVHGAHEVVALSKGQDDLGYYYPAFAYPFTAVYDSDHHIYNVAPQAGDQIIEGQVQNAGALGFATDVGVGRPLDNDYGQAMRPGLQALASPPAGAAGPGGTFTTTLQAAFSSAAYGGSPMAGKVHWDLGDGSSADTPAVDFGAGVKDARFTHAYRVGSYTVRLRARDAAGDEATWRLPVRVYPRLAASVAATRVGDRVFRLVGGARGGQGTILAWRWRFSDGAAGEGRTVVHRFAADAAPRATLTITDGTGSTARAVWGG